MFVVRRTETVSSTSYSASVLTLSLHESDQPGLGPGHELHHLATGASSQLGQLGLGQLKKRKKFLSDKT